MGFQVRISDKQRVSGRRAVAQCEAKSERVYLSLTAKKFQETHFWVVKGFKQCSHYEMNQVVKPRVLRFGLGSVLVVTAIIPVGSKVQSFNTDLKVELDAGLQM